VSGPRITLIGSEDLELRLRAALPELNGNLARWAGGAAALGGRHGLEDVLGLTPDVLVFGPEHRPESVLALAADLDRMHPALEVVLVAEPSPLLWEHAARSGVREIVSPLAEDEVLQAAFRRTMATVDGRQRSQAAPVQDDERRSLVVVRSPKGGSGKTMVASNVATVLAGEHPGDVVIVDLDLQYGDMATALGIEPTYTIGDATANVELTPTGLKALLTKHRSGLYALCAPPRPTEADVITGQDVTAVLALLQAAFRYVIVDTAAGTDARAEAALAEATDVVLVCSMDVSSVRAARKELDRSAHGPAVRRHIVLNRANSRVGLEVRDIEATLGVPVDVQVSSARSVPLHMNCGTPVVLAEPSSPVSRQLQEVVRLLTPSPARTGRARGWRR
jgi:pilus assembly protein CpaE